LEKLLTWRIKENVKHSTFSLSINICFYLFFFLILLGISSINSHKNINNKRLNIKGRRIVNQTLRKKNDVRTT